MKPYILFVFIALTLNACMMMPFVPLMMIFHPPKNMTHQSAKNHQNKWFSPPVAYANQRSERWNDSEAIHRGEKIYVNHCQQCHGVDGKGKGQMAANLPYPATNLTIHFHRDQGEGDAYLFWRVSEGGTVPPFQAMSSTMPAYKTILSEDERWDVLAYVHTAFHIMENKK
jgi:mono/diheme cytochrome c family protein